jgi:RNA polymerase sigma-70 factor (ECF subfamily)
MPKPSERQSAPAGSTSSSLLQRIRTRDEQGWQRLIDLYGPLVYHWCRRKQVRAEDQADVFQEVFRAVARNILSFRKGPGDSFRGWLLTITNSKIRDYFRRQQRNVQAPGGSDALQQLVQVPDPFTNSEDPSDRAADRAAEHAVLWRALDLLRGEFEDRTWQAFWRVIVEGHAPAEVAAALGVSVNAVYKARGRVLHRLRQELGEFDDSSP